jgi:hypothetical protein
LNNTSATTLNIAGPGITTQIGFFGVIDDKQWTNSQLGYYIIFARVSFQANSSGSRAMFLISDIQET